MTIKDKAVPNVVGVDIGCGMYTVNLGNIKIDFEKVQFDYLTFEDTFDQASKRAKEAHSTIYRVDLQTVKNPIVRGLKKFFGIIKLVHSEQIKIISPHHMKYWLHLLQKSEVQKK